MSRTLRSFRSKSSSSLGSVSISNEDRIQVAIRARPLNAKESGNAVVWRFSTGSIQELKDDGTSATGKRFSYDYVFSPTVTTANVYEALCKTIVEGAMEGYNGTIFAYGQTSSGKTYCMLGTPSKNPGINLLAIDDIFRTIQNQGAYEWTVHVAYMEIYNETITDLLSRDPTSGKNMKIYEDKRYGPRVRNLTELQVTASQECVNLLSIGETSRHYSATGMNDTSSRSHTIFQMRIESKSLGGLEGDESRQKISTVASELEAVRQQIDAEQKTLYIVDQENQKLHGQAVDSAVHIPISQSLVGACALDGQTLNIGDVHLDPRFNAEYDECSGYRCSCSLIVPIKSDTGEVLAVAQFTNKKQPDSGFTDDDKAKAETCAGCVSPLIQACKSDVRESRVGVLNLVDLAGSERVQKSASTGHALKEACFINKSLSTLGSCINILAEGTRQHVPFRDSKLTVLLSGSLGGNARTGIICAISPATRNRKETMSTLQFANRAKRIINKVQQNTQKDQSELMALYMTETEKLRSELGHMKVVNKWQVAALKASLDVQRKRNHSMNMNEEMRSQFSQLKNACAEAQKVAKVLKRPGIPSVQLHPLVTGDGEDAEGMRLLVEVTREGLPVTWISAEELNHRLGILMQIEANSSGPSEIDAWEASAKQVVARPQPIELVNLAAGSDAMQAKAAEPTNTRLTKTLPQSSSCPTSITVPCEKRADALVLEPKEPLAAPPQEKAVPRGAAALLRGFRHGEVSKIVDETEDQYFSETQSVAQKMTKREEPSVEDIQILRGELSAVMKNLDQLAVELDSLETQKRRNKASCGRSDVLDAAILTASTTASSEIASDLQLTKLYSLLQKASSLLGSSARSTSRTSRSADGRATLRSPEPNLLQGSCRTISPPRRNLRGTVLGHCPGSSPPRVRHAMPWVATTHTGLSSPSATWPQAGHTSSMTPMSPGVADYEMCSPQPQRGPSRHSPGPAEGAQRPRPMSPGRAINVSRTTTLSRTMTPVRYISASNDATVSLAAVAIASPTVVTTSPAEDMRQVSAGIAHERPIRARSAARSATLARGGAVRRSSSRTMTSRRDDAPSPSADDFDPTASDFVSHLQCLKKELDCTLEVMKKAAFKR
jgi:putative methionine-R-sulfoxide reductase with GAF domain